MTILAALAISYSQMHAVGFAESEQVVHYAAVSLTIPIGLLQGISLTLFALLREEPSQIEGMPVIMHEEPAQIQDIPIIMQDMIAPIPGKCTLKAQVGDTVEVGEVICVREVMKTECTMRSAVKGKIAEILVTDGSILQVNQPIIHIES